MSIRATSCGAMPASALPRDPAGTVMSSITRSGSSSPPRWRSVLKPRIRSVKPLPCGMTSSPGMWPSSMVSRRAMRASASGAVSSYIPTEADARIARLETMLEGHIPGLEVIPHGSGFTLRIRGFRTLRQRGGDDEPLLVIDDITVPAGSLGSALAGIAPHDVGRIDILKDAGTTAVYGSRGANGVIIIR